MSSTVPAMTHMPFHNSNRFLLAASITLISAVVAPGIPHEAGAAMYLCPGKGGQTLEIKPGPGCDPLVDQKPDEGRQVKPEISGLVKPGQLENAVTSFLARYREFVKCCATDTTKREAISDLEDEASEILKQADSLVGQRFSLISSHGALVLPVAEARAKLRHLKTTLDQLYLDRQRADSMDFEEGGRKKQKLNEEKATIERTYTPGRQPSRAPTGNSIGNSDLDQMSRTGPALSGTSTFNRDAAVGTESGRNSTINDAARTGTPSVGDSSMNQQSETGPALGGESTFNNSSRIGKDLENSSSFNKGSNTGPSVGNSDLNR